MYLGFVCYHFVLLSSKFSGAKLRLPSKRVTIRMETLDRLPKVKIKLYSLDHEDPKANTLSLHAYGVSRISHNSVNLKRNHDIFPDVFAIDYGFSGTALVFIRA